MLRKARVRSMSAALLLCAPSLLALALDAVRRGAVLVALPPTKLAYYALSLAQAWALWAALLYAAARRRGAWAHVCAVLFVLIYGAGLGSQQFFYEQYNAYMTRAVALFATGFWANVWNQLYA